MKRAWPRLGDIVRIIECRPLSKLKRWRLGEVVRKAALVAVRAEGFGRKDLELSAISRQRSAKPVCCQLRADR